MYDTSEVARLIGVSKQTLLRWIRVGLVPDVKRDQRGWRVWLPEDLARLRRFRQAYHATDGIDGEVRAATREEWASSHSQFQDRHSREADTE